jgi:FkbM family methyltransferase
MPMRTVADRTTRGSSLTPVRESEKDALGVDICFNPDARFTKWVLTLGRLREPFVVVDVGVQGGESVRWRILGDRLVVHGFDPIREVVEELSAMPGGVGERHYHWMAAGNEDGERDFWVRVDNPYASSLYEQGEDRYALGEKSFRRRRVPVRKLDTLRAQGLLPPADFVKVDVEGFERHVLAGAHDLLAASALGVEIESSFDSSPEYPSSHFGTVHALLHEAGLVVFDLNFNRIPRASFQHALQRAGVPTVDDQQSVGRVSTLNVLFCRDLIQEADHAENYAAPRPPASVDQIVKLMIIYELHGLNDVAVDTAERFRGRLVERFDVDAAIALLANPDCRGPRVGPPRRLRDRAARRLRPPTAGGTAGV